MDIEKRGRIEDQKKENYWGRVKDCVDRFRLAMSNPEQYMEIHGAGIEERLKAVNKDDSELMVLVPTLRGRGLIWSLDQVSRQEVKSMRLVVFQNGFEKGDKEQEYVESMCKRFGVEYVHDEVKRGAWGCKAYPLLNFESVIGGVEPKILFTIDDDTGALDSKFLAKSVESFEGNIAALYSPTVFISMKGKLEQLGQYVYKAASLTVQNIKIALGEYHSVGQNTGFDWERFKLAREQLLEIAKKEGYDRVTEDKIADALIATGSGVSNTFTPDRITFTAGDRIDRHGIALYTWNIVKVNFFNRAKGYEKMYQSGR